MKLIILTLLISLNSLADVKVSIKNNKNNREFGASFETQEKADAWIADNIANDSWGKKERWVKFKDQEDCLEIRDITFFDKVEYQECKLAKEYTITQEDITAQVQAEKDKKEADKIKIKNLKDKSKNMKLDELIELLELKGLI